MKKGKRKGVSYTYDIQDHILVIDKMYTEENNQNTLTDYSHIDLFDRMRIDQIFHTMVYWN
jgi:hypothetical protein